MNAITDGQLQEIRRLAESKGANSERVQQILRLGFLADLFEPRAKLEFSSREQSSAWGSFRSIRERVREQMNLTSIDSMYGTIEVNYRTPLNQIITECVFDHKVDSSFFESNFPQEKGKKKRKLTWKLIAFGRYTNDPEGAKIEMDERRTSFRHATLLELLAFRKCFQENGGSYVGYFESDIVAFGSNVTIRDYNFRAGEEMPMVFYPRLENVKYNFNGESNRYTLGLVASTDGFGTQAMHSGAQALVVAEYRPSHFHRNRVKGYIRKGSIVEGRTVVVIGKSCEFGIGNKLTPVRFEDGKCGIVSIRESDDERTFGIWNHDTPAAKEAVESSVEILTVRRGIGSDVIHVIGKDGKGDFLVKLFYNTKKHEYGRADELHR